MSFAFLDSGTGGIPYMTYLKRVRPDAECVYVADTRNFPYGEKSAEEITECAASAVSLITARWNPGAVVIACNTISVTALDELRRRFPAVPIVGTVPAIKPAAELSVRKRIGLLATKATAASPYVARLKERFASECELFARGDSGLVSFIEHRLFSASEEEKEMAVRPAVDFFASRGCDVIVLSCTHFLHMAEEIRRAAGPGVRVIDSRDGVARRALAVASERRPQEGGADCGRTDAPPFPVTERNPKESALFVTGFSGPDDTGSYRALCRRLRLSFGGILERPE